MRYAARLVVEIWLGHLDYSAWGRDRRLALSRIVDALKEGGWEVMMIDEPRQPPQES